MNSFAPDLRVAQVLPGGMRFEAREASSVELCVSDWIAGSRYRAATTVVAEESGEEPLLSGVQFVRLKSPPRLRALHQAWSIRQRAASQADVIVAQQHIPTAALIARVNRGTPVVLQTHNFLPGPASGRGAALRNGRLRAQLRALSGITFVSEATQAQFRADWPDLTMPGAVVNNGFDFDAWHPARSRDCNVLVVGRCEPEKGILEAAQGCKAFLAAHPGWRATFVLSATGKVPEYEQAVRAALAPAQGQAEVLTRVPFAHVKCLTERAALAVVASRWLEPFGRTALEAHAGGAALISSGTGGLREISGDAAVYLPEVSGAAIHAALRRLAEDPHLCASLAARALERVRSLFSLERTVCPRLDDFLLSVAAGCG